MAANARLTTAINAATTRPGTQYTLPGFFDRADAINAA